MSHLFFGIESLFFKTEALYLVKVETSFKWDYIVCGYTSDRFVCDIASSVESQSGLTRNHLDFTLVRFELPPHGCTGVCIEPEYM